MEWLSDTYTLIAGDVAAAWAGRAYNWDRKQFESVHGTEMRRSIKTRYRLRAIQVWVYNAAGRPKGGVACSLFVVADPQATGFKVELQPPVVQGGITSVVWMGDYPMVAGAGWRIYPGGVAATDRVDCAIGYEL